MQFKLLTVAALSASASAQMMSNLTAVLMNNTDLSNLTTYVSLFPSLVTSLQSAQNITILAPSNAAFAKYMNTSGGAQIAANNTAAIMATLSYHVLMGTYNSSMVMTTPAFIPTMLNNTAFSNVTGGQRVEAVKMGNNVTFVSSLLQQSVVTTADIHFTGGIIHIIDTLLTPPQNVSTTAVAAGLSAAAGALTSAQLVSTVDMLHDATIFVPNNAAFQAIGSATSSLTMQQIAGILEYHVINGTVAYSTSLMDGMMVKAVNGENLKITISNGTVFVNSAKVVTPDVLVANGVVHVIDNVLNPNDTMATPVPTATSQTVAFSGASQATNSMVPFTSGVPVPTSTVMASMTGGAASSSSTAGAFAPMRTGVMGAAALFAAGGMMMNA